MFSQEYIAAIALVIGGVLKAFGIEIANDAVSGIVVGGLALYIAIQRKRQGNLTAFGAYRK